MLSFVYSAASTCVKYSPLGSYVSAPSTSSPTVLSTVPHSRPTEPVFDASAATSSTRQQSTSSASSSWDSSSDSSDSSLPSSSRPAPSTPVAKPAANVAPDNDLNDSADRYEVINDILRQENLYDILGTPKMADIQQLRRAYITRSKRCHPDKFPEYPLATLAFQKVSFAYDTLSRPSTRRAYDKSSSRSHSRNASTSSTAEDEPYRQYHPTPDDTLNAVLYGVFCDFMDGDFEMIRTFLRAMGEINQRMQMGDDTVESLLASLMKLREILLVGQKYVRIVRFELIRMYEIQSSLRQLSYFDVRGRLRLTLQLARVTLSLPMVVDLAMREEDSGDSDGDSDEEGVQIGGRPHTHRRRKDRSSRGLDNGNDGRNRPRVKLGRVTGRRKRGLLPPPVSVVIGLAIGALEIGERVL